VKFVREVESTMIKPSPKSILSLYCSMQDGIAVIGEMVKFTQHLMLENSDHYSVILNFGQKILHE
jgi:hypothetical protein